MTSPACRAALATGPLARPRPVRSLLFASGTARAPASAVASVPARLAQQLRQLKQFKVWDVPAGTACDCAQPTARGGRQVAPARAGAPRDGADRPGVGGGRRPGIVWFRGDLRLHDHEALARAQAECSSLLPVYCFDPRDYGKSPQGYDKTGPYRASFLTEAVADLRAALRALGSELVVRCGRAEEVIGELVRRTGSAAVYCHTEVSFEELRVEAAVKAAAEAAGARLQAFWSNTLCHLDDLPFKPSHMPQSFDQFRDRVQSAAVRACLPAPAELRGLPLGGRLDPGDIPTLQQLGLQPLPAGCGAGAGSPLASASAAAGGSRSSGGGRAGSSSSSPRGGEGEALRQLSRFLAQAVGGPAGQRPATGAVYSSNFSSSVAPWLATGCLSPRRMLEDARTALAGTGPTAAAASASAAQPQAGQQPLTWVRFELLWRDFFRFLTLKYSTMSSAQLGSAKASQAARPALAAVA